MREMFSRLTHKVPHLIGLLFLLTSIACIPTWLIARDFDRNAAPQFVALGISAIVMGALLFFWKSGASLPKYLYIALFALVVESFISLMLSHNILSGLTGDTGRYTGVISLLALITISLLFSQLSSEQFDSIYIWIIAAVLIVDLLGLMQAWGWFAMPGDGGVGSTLGNLDFFSAWIGTTFPILLWKKIKSKHQALALLVVFFISIWLLLHIGAKQGVLDFIILIPAALIYLIRRKFLGNSLSTWVWTGAGVFLTVIWSEAIYLATMGKLPIPGVAHDPNVRMRSDFWYSGFGQFAHHLLFGVGPDNYGNFYEKYRSLSSIKLTETVLANDAHSSVIQSFATLGIGGMACFIALLVLFIRSLVVLIQSENMRWQGSILALFSFIYFTNSAISPITLPNKFLFWAIAGYAIGQAQRLSPLAPWSLSRLGRAGIAAMTALIAFISLQFAYADINYLNPSSHYRFSTYLPCTLYFDSQLTISAKTMDQAMKVAQREVSSNPRCLDAQSVLANGYLNQNNLLKAHDPIYAMLDIAPGRRQVVRVAAIYALRAKDAQLQKELVGVGLKLGVLTQGG